MSVRGQGIERRVYCRMGLKKMDGTKRLNKGWNKAVMPCFDPALYCSQPPSPYHTEKTLKTMEIEDMLEGIFERFNSQIQDLESRPVRFYTTHLKF